MRGARPGTVRGRLGALVVVALLAATGAGAAHVTAAGAGSGRTAVPVPAGSSPPSRTAVRQFLSSILPPTRQCRDGYASVVSGAGHINVREALGAFASGLVTVQANCARAAAVVGAIRLSPSLSADTSVTQLDGTVLQTLVDAGASLDSLLAIIRRGGADYGAIVQSLQAQIEIDNIMPEFHQVDLQAARLEQRFHIGARLANWHELVTPFSGTTTLNDVACPAPTTCYAVGDAILATRDGGTTWQRQLSVNTSTTSLDHIACPTTSTCYVLTSDGLILATHDAGRTWHRQRSSLARYDAQALTCPTLTTCFGAGYESDGSGRTIAVIVATTDGGAAWRVGLRDRPNSKANGLACVSVQTCYAVGTAVWITQNGGAAWHRLTTHLSDFILASISCPVPTSCYAISQGTNGSVLWTQDAGRTWHPADPGLDEPDRQDLTAIACPTATTCYTVTATDSDYTDQGTGDEGQILVTGDAGEQWTSQQRNLANLYGLACPAPRTCYAVGHGVLMATFTGS